MIIRNNQIIRIKVTVKLF